MPTKPAGRYLCGIYHAGPTKPRRLGGGLQTCGYKYAALTGLGRLPLNPL
ncbi:hypothetical protein [Desulfonema magnum]|uniref:Uncharacterized protein n=1 Tax=Desulfonema magnum TaxID=45655 RepID=A0A975BVG7_9BACT|nr:hypothetical protein [Desulfonema magnum]QTA92378.1 Uncharacterized protein dnm_084570 [Desulfonema magnum]